MSICNVECEGQTKCASSDLVGILEGKKALRSPQNKWGAILSWILMKQTTKT